MRTARAGIDGVLTREQRHALLGSFLWVHAGCPEDPAFAFASADEARAAWELHRDRIMAAWYTPFRRPRWWWIERGERYGTAREELERLQELGELTQDEVVLLADLDAGRGR